MLWPTNEGDYESWESLAPTLMPFVKDQIGELFAPWTVANTTAIMSREAEFSVQLKGQTYTQKLQKYHAKSLQVLRDKYAKVSGNTELTSVLETAGCLIAVQS
ncbi:MAG: hypothetical protein ACI9UN_002172 [Granulosicoccus sp.]|jgi:hypothetical protein